MRTKKPKPIKTLLPDGVIEGDIVSNTALLVPDTGPPLRKLNAQERKFVELTQLGTPPEEKARACNYKGQHWSNWCHRMARRPHVAAELERRMPLVADRIEYTEVRVLDKLAMIAEANAVDAFVMSRPQKKDGSGKRTEDLIAKMRPIHEWPTALKVAVKSLKFGTDGSVTIEMHDKLRALTKIGEHFGMFATAGRRGDEPPPDGAITEETFSFEKRMERNGTIIRGRLDRRTTRTPGANGSAAPGPPVAGPGKSRPADG